jgi:predicted RNA-binding protein with PIN domain
MPYIIDGHNLIAHTQGIDLDDPDDEEEMIRLLRSFCARTEKAATVYFDQGALGAGDPPIQGGLQVRFITRPRTADQAILTHIGKLGREAPNWTVVSSDRAILKAAQHAGVRGLSSQDFAPRLVNRRQSTQATDKPSFNLTDDEVKEWETIFREKQEGDN